jgi:hypothetical protein
LLYPAELRAQIIGKITQVERFCFAFFTVLFYGRPCETAKTYENLGKNAAPNLIRHKTSQFSVAQAKLAEFLKRASRAGHLR